MWVIDLGKYKGLPIYWKSKNEKCIIVYDQFAFSGKYKLYLNERYVDSSDFMGGLIEVAKKSYFLQEVVKMEDNTVHKTVTGKEFILTDLEGNPLNYNDYKGSFTRQHLAMLEVGQILKSSSLGIMLKRTK